jgi:hypothetical protein
MGLSYDHFLMVERGQGRNHVLLSNFCRLVWVETKINNSVSRGNIMIALKQVTIFAALFTALTATSAIADNGRYVMVKVEKGYVRMDTQSGAMSMCQTQDDQIICKMAADERAAFNEDIAALEDRIAALEEKFAGGAPLASKDGLPSDEEFERGLGYMEKFMRRFMGIAKEFGESETAN